MKKCSKCNEIKELKQFGKDNQKKDRLCSSCKKCVNLRNSKYREMHTEYFIRYSKNYRECNKELLREKAWIDYYNNWDLRALQGKKSYEKHKEKIALRRAEKRRIAEEKEKNRLRQAKWRNENKSKVAERVSKWKKRNPEKSAAHTLVLWAIRTGILVKSNCCEECNKICKTEGHHNDYLKPLEVNWLCKSCHSNKHKVYR